MSNNKALTDQQKRARDKLYTLYKRDGLPDELVEDEMFVRDNAPEGN